jgi:hypothetical protein
MYFVGSTSAKDRTQPSELRLRLPLPDGPASGSSRLR